MSVANILDATTGEIKPEYLGTSAIVENQITPFNVPITATLTDDGFVQLPGTDLTGLNIGDIYQYSGQYDFVSNSGPPGTLNLVVKVYAQGGDTGDAAYIITAPFSTTPITGTFNVLVKVPPTSFFGFPPDELRFGIFGEVGQTGTQTINVRSLFINKINP